MENIRNITPRKGSFLKYLSWLASAYLVVAIFLLFNSKLILDLTLSSFYIVAVFVVVTMVYAVLTFNKKYGIVAILVAILYILALVVFSPIISYKAHRGLAGEVQSVEFSNEIDVIDLKQLPTIDKDLAYK
ncbi:cell shape-determining protein, partial [Clostridium perfringens]|nr:cell shape-determining protein [Clostridium perfringens]